MERTSDSFMAPNGSVAGPTSPIVAAYFPEWGIYGRDYNIADVPADQLTHLIYSFTKIDENGEIALFDSWAATGVNFSAAESVDGVADTWDQSLAGNFNQIAELKAAHPDLKVSVALGGWTLSQNFSSVVSTEEGRETLAESIVDFMKTYEMFDGIDLDWEYPGGGGMAGNESSPEDGANYALLVAEVRQAFDALEAETGRDYQISIAAPAGYDKIADFNLAGLAPNVDFINMMAYDFYGAWQNQTGHQAAIFDTSGGTYDIATALELYLAAGVPPEKIVLGVPMYTRAWTDVDASDPENAIHAASGGAAPGSFEAGIYDFKDILEKLEDPNSGWKLYYDDEAQAAFVWNADEGIFSSFETPATVALKSEWAQAQGLGGMMLWDLSNDATGHPESLLSAAYASWLQGKSFEEIANASQLEFEAVFGGDGQALPIAEADTPDTTTPDEPDTPDTPDTPDDPDIPDTPDTPDTPTPPSTPESWNGDANVTAATATVVITWAWGTNRSITDFDPSSDTIFIDWFGPEAIDVAEVGGDTVFTMASNNQTVTLENVALNDLSAANFTIMNSATGQEILAQVGAGSGSTNPDEPDDPHAPDHPHGPQMIMITPDSASRVIDDFDPARDMLHLEAGVIAERLEFGDSPQTIADAPAGLSIRVLTPSGEVASETVLAGIQASDLTMNNFMVAEESALNEVASLLGQAVVTPDSGGFDIVYDNDGSDPAVSMGTSDAGGVKWAADFGADDIIGFNPAADEIDFGNASVHGLILTMTPNGEPIIDNPWGPDMQILQGVQLADLSIESFGVVGNEHLRQDLGGILSWEKGIGPRDADTVYIRSHEYGASEVIDDFDPATQKISFLYFGTRERLSVEDTPDGMVISSLPSGQSFTFTGVTKADLVAGNVEFHFDQVMEDNLEAAFGFDQEDVSLVSREALLTPEAPAGETTDGHQVRDGVGVTPDPDEPDTPDTPDTPTLPPLASDDIVLEAGSDTVLLTWDWGRVYSVQNFDPAEDILNFGSLSASDLLIEEVGSDLLITVQNNGGHGYVLEGVQAEDLTAANLTAPSWNSVITDAGGIAEQLQALGNQDLFV